MSISHNYSLFNEEQKRAFIHKHYVQGRKSFAEVAKLSNTYANKVRRDAIKLGFELRDRSKAQKLALETGRVKHPTKGKQRTEATKLKISQTAIENWENLSDEEKARRAEVSKKRWEDMSDEQRQAFDEAKFEAIRKAAKEGSKLEKYIHEELIGAGHVVLYHQKHTLGNDKLELDLVLPESKIAIEIDGISHVEAIWGVETFQRNQKADTLKNGLLLANGYYVIRLKCSKNLNKVLKKTLLEELLSVVDKIKSKTQSDKYIEIGE